MKYWKQTFTGRAFDLENPRASDVHLDDIVRSLSHQVRYTGHAKRFYTVAEHSIIVARILFDALSGDDRWEVARFGLVHDFAETYTGDMASPWKAMLDDRSDGVVRRAEEQIDRAVHERFGLNYDARPRIVKAADIAALATEKEQIMGPAPRDWGIDHPPLSDVRIEGWSPTKAEHELRLECARLGVV